MSELNKIFDVKSREARRKILDNYPISANDKNEILNKIGNSSGEGGKARYFKVKEGIDTGGYEAAGLQYLQYYNCFTLKAIDYNDNLVITQGYNSLFITDYKEILAYSFTPGIVSIFDDHGNTNERTTIACKYCATIEEFIELAKLGGGDGSSVIDPLNPYYIEKEITEEEYCQLVIAE